MAQNPTALKVSALIKDAVEALGVQLWDVKFVKEGASWYLRVFIDKEEGVDINDCTDVSRLIDPIIDEADPINVSYYLEVCSPGLERELTESWHFEKYMGADVKVKLIRPKDGQREFSGKLKSYDGGVTIESDGADISFTKAELVYVKLDDASF